MQTKANANSIQKYNKRNLLEFLNKCRLRAAPIFSYSPPRVKRKKWDAEKLGWDGARQAGEKNIFSLARLAPTPPPAFARTYFFAPFSADYKKE